jgi:hypothetical protein
MTICNSINIREKNEGKNKKEERKIKMKTWGVVMAAKAWSSMTPSL